MADEKVRSNNNVVINIPSVGMKLSKAQSQLNSGEFSLALNANIITPVGNILQITNESSSLLCSEFKEGYKEIGLLQINILNRTIYFLVNPSTGDSEIGYIDNISYSDLKDKVLHCKDCNNPLIEDKPLEQIKQVPLCNYNTIVSATCLNFSIDSPITATYEIGIDVATGLPDCNNVTIFFADNNNPRRYLNTSSFPKTLLTYDTENCNTPIYSNELDCNAIKVAADYNTPCISTLDIITGGSLIAGSYQFTAAYSNINGSPLVDYFTVTNPTPISSKQRVVTINTDYPTDKAIKLQLSNLDTGYQYFNLVVLETINSTTSPFLIGTFPISSETFSYTYSGNNHRVEDRLTLDEIIKKNPIYENAGLVAKGNGHLFWGDLKEQRELNLQPAVNNLRINWQTIEAPEDFYANPINATNSVSYLRDEVVPFGIQFKKSNGFTTATFLISGRDATYYQNTLGIDVNQTFPDSNPNVISSGNCDTISRNKYWEIYDSSNSILYCDGIIPPPSSEEELTTFCQVGSESCSPTGGIDFYSTTFIDSGTISSSHPLFTSLSDACSNTGTVYVGNVSEACAECLYNTYLADNPDISVLEVLYHFEATDTATCIGSGTLIYKGNLQIQLRLDVPTPNPSGNCTPFPACNDCNQPLYAHGDFQYWQSSLNYPSNPDVWGELCGQPIRYTKFPANCTSHIHNNPDNLSFSNTNKIYPIGVKIDINEVKRILNNAVQEGLISEQEKLEIIGYNIKRANRRSNKSVVANGLIYDVFKTPFLTSYGIPLFPTQNQYFANFPYNDLSPNIYIRNSASADPDNFLQHPNYPDNFNNRYVFHSPNTHFAQPFLGTEIKIQTIEYGVSRGQFLNVDKHSEYVLLKQTAYSIATGLASAEAFLDLILALSSSNLGTSIGTNAGVTSVPSILLVGGLLSAIGGFINGIFKYQQQWVDIITKLGRFRNCAAFYTSKGNYSNFCCMNSPNDKFISSLDNIFYLNPHNTAFQENGEEIYFNNVRRESSVYLHLESGNFLPPYSYCDTRDNSRVALPTSSNRPLLNTPIDSNIQSYYVSIKNYVPDQYGTPDQIDWIDTGYCGRIEWDNITQDNSCDTIFGGDTYINKMEEKHKFPLFSQERVNASLNSDIQYSLLGNVGLPTYFFDTIQDFDAQAGTPISTIFTAPDARLIGDGNNLLYHKGVSLLYSYGIPSYFCESDYNVALRHAENDLEKNFPANVGDLNNWTQEAVVPIFYDNYYFYNQDYSKQNRENFFYTLKNSFSNAKSECRSEFPNRVIYSPEGVVNWLDYLASDYYDFPIEDGALIGINEIEQQSVLVRQENSTRVYNAFITVETSLATAQISVGNMFAAKPREYYKSDLGFGGSTHKAFVSTPFGHFYVDTQNPSIFQKQGDSLNDITRDSNSGNKIQWFIEFLPFEISKDFATVDVDNNFKYFGIALCWDNRYDRLFITKRDAKLRTEFKDKVTYSNNAFFYNDLPITPTDERYFINKSWTIAYSPIIKDWISFYSFTPNYYNSTETYFQSGLNYSTDNAKLGLYSHNLTNKSYQVFNQVLYPHIIEYSTKNTILNTNLDSVSYNHSVQRWQDELSFFNNNDKTFTEALIYTDNESTGILHLIPKQKNNLYQFTQYPKIIKDGKEILVDNIEYNWRFNQELYDISLQNNQPLMIYNEKPYKEPNPLSLSYKPVYFKNKIKGDSFYIRLTNSKHSQYRFINEFNLSQQNDSNI